ncbi:ABC transporter permease [Roseiterribacter gracilis]|uniref:Sulfate transporter n=1 Tax=Roseiterribacter gracilis TaxID=2812848 RepID=A0A8S8X8X4_9PROT|nr:sulfate transporter [Rhodospirillales bacterium TMPK1]
MKIVDAARTNADPDLSDPDAQDAGSWDVEADDDRLTILVRGHWDLRMALRADAELRETDLGGAARGVIDLTAVSMLDTMAALVVMRLARRIEATGATVELRVADSAHRSLLEQVEQAQIPPPPRRRMNALTERVARVGKWAVLMATDTRDLLAFFGELCVVLLRIVRHPRRLRFVSMVANMQAVGLNAVPIVGLLSFLIGVVLAYQGADQLRRFGAEVFTVNLLTISVLREIGILMTAIIIAGRSGSSFTAQIGTMKINQEVDAMRTMGLDPMEVLVVPRVLALALTLPLLGFYSDIMGLLGGALMCRLNLGINFDAFLNQMNQVLAIYDTSLWVGLAKAPVFAVVIALVGCFHGLEVSGSAESVGQRTTISVVQAIFIVIVLDAIFSIVFSALQI